MIHTRQQLVRWIEGNVTDRIIQNALASGRVENLGGFNPLPTSRWPGWIVSVTSRWGIVHNIAVVSDNSAFELRWFRVRDIPWENWIGVTTANPLYQGDRPDEYRRWKDDPRSSNP